jgi:hypothetical protein
MANSPIILTDEAAGKKIKFHLDNTVIAHQVVSSDTFIINPYNADHVSLIRKINDFDSSDPNIVNGDVKFITIVHVIEDPKSNPGAVTPIELRNLTYLEDSDNDLAVVVTVKDKTLLELKHKPKRTKGKVSNSLG